MSRAHQVVGYSKHRDPSDAYGTDPIATHALFARESFYGVVWEPACGIGMMSKVIEDYNQCYSSDIRTNNKIYGDGGIDFLGLDPNDYEVANIITNPPYKYALEFVEQAKRISTCKIAMLLKLTFLEGKTRYDMFHDLDYPLKKVYVFSRRLTLVRENSVVGNTGMIAYAWFVWEKMYDGMPTLDWILL